MDREWLLLEQAEKASDNSIGPVAGRILVRLAELSAIRGETGQISDRIGKLLTNPAVDLPTLRQAINLLSRYDSLALAEVARTPPILQLEPADKLQVIQELMTTRTGESAAAEILKTVVSDAAADDLLIQSAKNELCICLIGLGRFNEALKLFDDKSGAVADMHVADAFNYAMAEWGAHGKPRTELLEQVLKCDESGESRANSANYKQCVALVLLFLKRAEEGNRWLSEAEEEIRRRPSDEFSCWSYLKVTPRQFLEEIKEMKVSFDGPNPIPRFLQTGGEQKLFS